MPLSISCYQVDASDTRQMRLFARSIDRNHRIVGFQAMEENNDTRQINQVIDDYIEGQRLQRRKASSYVLFRSFQKKLQALSSFQYVFIAAHMKSIFVNAANAQNLVVKKPEQEDYAILPMEKLIIPAFKIKYFDKCVMGLQEMSIPFLDLDHINQKGIVELDGEKYEEALWSISASKHQAGTNLTKTPSNLLAFNFSE
ncbi:MAG: hypothetical protein AAF242_06090 [Bacteroidota bacterium]